MPRLERDKIIVKQEAAAKKWYEEHDLPLQEAKTLAKKIRKTDEATASCRPDA